MPSERIEFPGSLGETLAGRLDTPDNAPHAWAVFAHCFTCSKDSKAAAFIARALSEAGFGVLRFDFTGLGGSGGDFANTHFSSNVDDLLAAAAWLRTHHGAPSLLIGHSLGGQRFWRRPDVSTIAGPWSQWVPPLSLGTSPISWTAKACR
ncbi:alpha/beta fold hydrolase [Hydrogenophaga crassostreae]|uniref:alpha/beta fold hydrolase n=1 Tax=Hydrogenophaga crassostreae TaxID=1763535 RepID=UPI000A659F5F